MFLAPASPAPSLPALNASAFLAGAAAQAAIGRLPTQEVPRVLSDSQIFSRLRNQGGSASATAQDVVENAPDYLSEMIAHPPASGLSRGSGFSSAFMAQMLGYDANEESGIYLRAYEKLINLAKVRYKPSNAGLPLPHGPANEFRRMLGTPELAFAANEQQDAATRQAADIPEQTAPPALPAPFTDTAPSVLAYAMLQSNITRTDHQPIQLTA